MISRRSVLAGLVTGVLPVVALSRAQETRKVYRVGYLSGGSENRPMLDAFRDGMRRRGYVEGGNMVIDTRFANGNPQRLAALAADLIRLHPHVLLVATTPANVAVKAATSTVPIVMVAVADPVGAGIVRSLSAPGSNITGITNNIAQLAGKRLEILKELLPGATRIAVLVNPDNDNASVQMRSAEAASRQLGIELAPVLAVRRREDLARAFKAAAHGGASGAIRMIDPLAFILRRQTVALAAKHRLPVIYTHQEDVTAGGLIAYGANLAGQYRQAARLVDRILRGARPGDLPVEQPTKFELFVNLRTAKTLGIAVPQSILLRADELVE